MAEAAPGLSIRQVAGRTGLSVHALRFYERGPVGHPRRVRWAADTPGHGW